MHKLHPQSTLVITMSKQTLMIIITLAIFATTAKMAHGFEYFYITNDVWSREQVTFRCQSGDSDTGLRKLRYGETYEQRFEGMWPSTLYFCHFYLEKESKDKVFDVWVYKGDKEGCTVWKENPWYLPDERVHNGQVEWVIREMGFFKHCVYKRREVDDEGRVKKLPLDTKLEKKHDW